MVGNIHTAMNIGALGVMANSHAMAVISDNIANVGTVGFKTYNNQFRTLMQNSAVRSRFTTGGVINQPLQETGGQGILRPTDNPTDLSIRGRGFFVATKDAVAAAPSDYVLTRAGRFRADSQGRLVNTGGYYLQGWPYDRTTETLPGTAQTRATDYSLLQTINLDTFSGNSEATKNIDFRINLDAATDAQELISTYKSGRSFDYQSLSLTDPVFTDTEGVFTIASETLINQPIAAGDTLDITGTGNDGLYTVAAFNSATGTVTVTEPVVTEAVKGAATVRHTNSAPTPQGTLISAPGGAEFIPGKAQIVAADLIDADMSAGDYILVRTAKDSKNSGMYRVKDFDAETGTVTLDEAPKTAEKVDALSFDVIGAENAIFLQDEFASAAGEAVFNLDDNSLTSSALLNQNFKTGDQIEIKTDSGENDGFWVINSYDASTGSLTLASRDGVSTMSNLNINNDQIKLFRHISSVDGLGSAHAETYMPSQLAAFKTMAGGDKIPDFSRGLTVFDGQGVEHPLTLNFIKSDEANTWYVEMSSASAYSGTEADAPDFHPNGLIGFGKIKFNTDGTLAKSESTMYVPTFNDEATPPVTFTRTSLDQAQNYQIVWDPAKTGASGSVESGLMAQTIENIDFGSDNKTDGMGQIAGHSFMYGYEIDGAEYGRYSHVTVDAEGWLSAHYTNGLSHKAYKLPVANGANPSGLRALPGDAYQQTNESGAFSLGESGLSQGAQFLAQNLEQSTVDLATQFTNMIVVQRAYSAASKLITTADEMLQEASRLTG